MRNGCLDCVTKHLGEAAIFEEEYHMGYPQYYMYVVGCLSHASMEIYEFSAKYAEIIRQHRLNWMDDSYNYKIPYEEIYRAISSVVDVKGETIHGIPISEDAMTGLSDDQKKMIVGNVCEAKPDNIEI